MNIPINLSLHTKIKTYENGNAIYFDSISDVYRLIIEEYYLPKYTNTVFLCTPCYPHFAFDGSTFVRNEDISQYKHKIFCNFDHYNFESYMNGIFDWCMDLHIDEIWEWQINIMNKYPEDLKDLVKFMPVRYISKYEQFAITLKDPVYLFAFCGNIGEYRMSVLEQYTSQYAPIKVLCGIRYLNNTKEFENCACVFNIHYHPDNYQEQLRICEFLSLNIPVVSEASDINYFGNLVPEITPDEIGKLYIKLRNNEIIIPENPAQKYKALTHTDEAFEKYRKNLLEYHRII